MKRACKVITTYFGPRRNYPHNLNETLNYWTDILLPSLLNTDAGVESDILVVNHEYDPVSRESKKFLNEIDGVETKNGLIKILNRPFEDGVGGGYKSRDVAFKKFQDDYEYWFFSEDDTDAWLDNYLKKSIDYLEEHQKVAFVCCQYNQVARFSYLPAHCHGGVGCTKAEFLKEVVSKYGSLSYSKEGFNKAPNEQYYDSFIEEGEVKFTQVFLELGHCLGYIKPSVQNPSGLSSFAHGLFRKNCRKVKWPCYKHGPRIPSDGPWEERFPDDYDIVHSDKGFIRFNE